MAASLIKLQCARTWPKAAENTSEINTNPGKCSQKRPRRSPDGCADRFLHALPCIAKLEEEKRFVPRKFLPLPHQWHVSAHTCQTLVGFPPDPPASRGLRCNMTKWQRPHSQSHSTKLIYGQWAEKTQNSPWCERAQCTCFKISNFQQSDSRALTDSSNGEEAQEARTTASASAICKEIVQIDSARLGTTRDSCLLFSIPASQSQLPLDFLHRPLCLLANRADQKCH